MIFLDIITNEKRIPFLKIKIHNNEIFVNNEKISDLPLDKSSKECYTL